MKKILITFAVLFTLLAAALAGVYFFVDLNGFRPQIEEKIEQATGYPVGIGHIGLGWEDGPALTVRGIQFHDPGSRNSSQALLVLDKVYANLHFPALLEKRFQVTSLMIDSPELKLIRLPNGEFQGLQPSLPESAKPTGALSKEGIPSKVDTASDSGAPLALLIEEFRLRDGKITYLDQGLGMQRPLTVTDIDVRTDGFRLGEAIKAEAQARFLSNSQNLKLHAAGKIVPERGVVVLQEAEAGTDLKNLRIQDLAEIIPGLQPDSLPDVLEGTVRLTAPSLTLPLKTGESPQVNLVLEQGRIKMPAMAQAAENLSADVLFGAEQAVIRSFTGLLASGKIAASGNLNYSKLQNNAFFRLSATGLQVEELVRPVRDQPYLTGRVTLTTESTVSAFNDLPKSVSGTGRILMKDGILHNLNILGEVFRQLSIIPGLVQRLESRLPETYKEKLSRKDTPLEDIDQPFRVQDGVVFLDSIRLAADGFSVTGTAQYRLTDDALAGKLFLIIGPELSEAFIRSVEELRYLADPQGRLQVPFSVRGTSAKPVVTPDVASMTTSLALNKAGDFIGGLVKKKESAPAPQPEIAVEQPADDSNQLSQQAKDPTTEELIGGLLQTFLGDSGKRQTSSQE